MLKIIIIALTNTLWSKTCTQVVLTILTDVSPSMDVSHKQHKQVAKILDSHVPLDSKKCAILCTKLTIRTKNGK